ncbi:hypothetical protein DWB61_08680 [Ancylomarina euxinus]|uniref:Uncharacterized protein n=1 Tax=Ancylomarina euxinus TaxID=2283627 RepID=A0A425Y1J4_9BACT|nr:hypothetical protein [Ancylomarina euxinus]MCZ4695139.1 hypothetical protein [Ancylomarina euxinus]MUP14926.1 hypothetical protein [Ancylomarina euxinus]RRG21820.1 hypothetical protein DWB61_08680 [Ancylomarina euxinus]
MDKNIIIKTKPVELTEKQKCDNSWQLRQKIAQQDLECVQKSILRDLENNIPVQFKSDIVVTLSISLTTLKIKKDYSEIRNKSTVRLIRYYLSRDMNNFVKELMKLVNCGLMYQTDRVWIVLCGSRYSF